MTLSERASLMHALAQAKPDVSIEIGTFLGGSLRAISAASRKVYTFDIDDRSFPGLDNVTFVAGNSSVTVPPVIDELNASDSELNFILIDGDHSEEGVRRDIENCIRYRPKTRPTVILMHDSCNPTVRRGIESAAWDASPHVKQVVLDFVPGVLFDSPALKGQIWGGLAAAVLSPGERSGGVPIHKPFQHALDAMLEKSVYV